MMTPEQLREHWKALQAPPAFRPDEPNWIDLTVREIVDQTKCHPDLVDRKIHILGMGSVDKDLYEMDRDLVEGIIINSSTHPGKKYTIPEIMDGFGDSSKLRTAMPFLDPEDVAYFGMGYDLIVRLSPAATLISAQWRSSWSIRVDRALNLTSYASLSEAQAKTLIPPQRVVTQHRSASDPSIYLINRENLFYVPVSGRDFARTSIKEGGWLFSFQLLEVPRQGRYPFSDVDKAQVIETIIDVLNQSVAYERKYISQLLALYSFAQEEKIPLTSIFAATES